MERPKKMVAYFEHEDVRNKGFRGEVRHLQEIEEHGFNGVVICVSEITVANRNSIDFVNDFTTEAKVKELATIADPWGLCGVFGGEAEAPSVECISRFCYCDDHLDYQLLNWLDTVATTGVEGVFWDEAETDCKRHNLVDFLGRYTEEAAKRGLSNSVCLTANPKNIALFDQVASLSYVDDFGCDPYPQRPFFKHHKRYRSVFVAEWALRTLGAADKNGKDPHIWVPGFNIEAEDENIITELVEVVRDCGIDNISFWGFRGCESLFEHQPGMASPQKIWQKTGEIFRSF